MHLVNKVILVHTDQSVGWCRGRGVCQRKGQRSPGRCQLCHGCIWRTQRRVCSLHTLSLAPASAPRPELDGTARQLWPENDWIPWRWQEAAGRRWPWATSQKLRRRPWEQKNPAEGKEEKLRSVCGIQECDREGKWWDFRKVTPPLFSADYLGSCEQ